jgi:hypothetical protein
LDQTRITIEAVEIWGMEIPVVGHSRNTNPRWCNRMNRDDFNFLGFLKLQGYVIQVPHWALNPTYSIGQVAKALSEVSGKAVKIKDIEAILMANEILH